MFTVIKNQKPRFFIYKKDNGRFFVGNAIIKTKEGESHEKTTHWHPGFPVHVAFHRNAFEFFFEKFI